jgi:hypothetical protein
VNTRKGDAMKKRCCTGIMLALSIMVVALPGMARAEVINFMGYTVQAEISSTDECLFTNVFILVFENSSHNPPGPGSSSSQIQVFISQLDTCSETLLFAAGGALLEDREFQTRAINSAILNTTVAVIDFSSGAAFNVNINLTWSGIGPITRDTFRYHSKLEDCIINLHSNSTFRAAEVAGSVSDGTTNFTPDTSFNAFLSNSKEGRVEVNCEPE